MTGYLHIPTDELASKLAQWFEITLTYHNFKTWDDGQFGGEMVEFLRGLSVEPTEERPRFEVKAMRLPPHGALRFIYHNAAGRQVSTFYPDVNPDRVPYFDHVREVAALLAAAPGEPTEDDRSPERCRAYAAVLMGVVPELDDPESAELVTRRAMQWEAEADSPVAAPVPVQEDRE
jgi:hypothetical protein